MKGLVGPLFGGKPGARAPCPPPRLLNPALVWDAKKNRMDKGNEKLGKDLAIFL